MRTMPSWLQVRCSWLQGAQPAGAGAYPKNSVQAVCVPRHTTHANLEVGCGRPRRDATLPMPVLILPSVQVNIRAGERPPPESNGISYLKIPMDAL